MSEERTWVDREAPVERIDLGDGAWVDVVRRWVPEPDEVYEHLLANVAWQGSQLFRYDHFIEENRVGAWWARGKGTPLPHPALAEATRVLQHRYGVSFDGFALLQYRTGADGQAFHRDTDMRYLEDTIIAVLSLGRHPAVAAAAPHGRATRTRRARAPPTTSRRVGRPAGDGRALPGRLGALGAVPRTQSTVGPRISIQWRFARPTGRPFQGASYRAPRTTGATSAVRADRGGARPTRRATPSRRARSRPGCTRPPPTRRGRRPA